jgi:hypothetical protein
MLANDMTSVFAEMWPKQIDLMVRLLRDGWHIRPSYYRPAREERQSRPVASDGPGQKFIVAMALTRRPWAAMAYQAARALTEEAMRLSREWRIAIIVGIVCLGVGVLLGRLTLSSPEPAYESKHEYEIYITCMNLYRDVPVCADVMRKLARERVEN